MPENREQEMQELVPGETRPVYDDIPSEDDDDDISEGTNQTGIKQMNSFICGFFLWKLIDLH